MQHINEGDATYLSDLRKYLGENAPRRITALGNIGAKFRLCVNLQQLVTL
jgi:hypothetical protein